MALSIRKNEHVYFNSWRVHLDCRWMVFENCGVRLVHKCSPLRDGAIEPNYRVLTPGQFSSLDIDCSLSTNFLRLASIVLISHRTKATMIFERNWFKPWKWVKHSKVWTELVLISLLTLTKQIPHIYFYLIVPSLSVFLNFLFFRLIYARVRLKLLVQKRKINDTMNEHVCKHLTWNIFFVNSNWNPTDVSLFFLIRCLCSLCLFSSRYLIVSKSVRLISLLIVIFPTCTMTQISACMKTFFLLPSRRKSVFF